MKVLRPLYLPSVLCILRAAWANWLFLFIAGYMLFLWYIANESLVRNRTTSYVERLTSSPVIFHATVHGIGICAVIWLRLMYILTTG
jgi:hypothetical protein